MPIIFSAIAPHPPIILPSVGSPEDREKVGKTIKFLQKLGEEVKEKNPDRIIISSPHPDWGFDVPLFFLAPDTSTKTEKILIGGKSPDFYLKQGEQFYFSKINPEEKNVLIASGDLSHRLKEEGPYDFHPDGEKFDKELLSGLKNKDIEKITNLDTLYPEAGECGLRSICFILGILEASKINYRPEVLSYEAPFGVGYLVANFKI